MSVKGLVSLLFCVLLVASGIWLTLDQAQQERQWNLQKDAANGVIPGELPGDEATAGTGEQSSEDDNSGIVNMLP
ncbi:hypothetical protein [Kushneria phyllosphaerae]|uniref:Uncharacterized protein n=1 Tax=Kushneria phyllosphaerae TaxID=2100822 RepID=A0A2R8CKR7_9GAMM|nr:hypothetical protein [Kushneria phyllosphaerae]SPJ33479.1 hypothetical protein KSP9073_01488 [Kushneria phyllosphaerae]